MIQRTKTDPVTFDNIGEFLDGVHWFEKKPLTIQDLFCLVPPNSWWRVRGTGDDFYLLEGYNENGTLRMTRCNGKTGKAIWEVFGILPSDLVPIPDDVVLPKVWSGDA